MNLGLPREKRYEAMPRRCRPRAGGDPYVDGPSVARAFAGACDRIACDHMSGLFLRSQKTAGPYVDGPSVARAFAGACDRIACDHMSGLFLRSQKTAGPY